MLSDDRGANTACPPPENAPVAASQCTGSQAHGADKLKRKSEFDEVKASRLKWNDPLFTFLAVNAEKDEMPRCGIICSRRFHKRAVVRNRARRILWEAFRLLCQERRIPPCKILMIPKRKICGEKMWAVKAHLERLLPWLKKNLNAQEVERFRSLSQGS